MSVRLISISRPVADGIPDTAALLAYCARVSATANQNKHETGGRLLRSLVRRKEWSPLEMISLTMEIVTTRDIARQILRHRSFSFQEFSQRYAVVEDEPVFREARLQHPTDRQMSVEVEDSDENFNKVQAWRDMQADAHHFAKTAYDWALTNGIAKEVARAVLPEGMTTSRLYMAGTLRSWLHWVDLRSMPSTQKEHRLLALDAAAILRAEFPDLAGLIGGEAALGAVA